MSTWVTIPCHRPYLEQLQDCLYRLRGQVPPNQIVVVANGPDPIRFGEIGGAAELIHYEGPEQNLSRLWNLGLDWAAARACGADHNALVLNADALVSSSTLVHLGHALRLHELAMVGPDVRGVCDALGVTVWRNQELKPGPKTHCVPGYCFMLRGELGLRCDPNLPGWYNDDDIEWSARRAGGVGLVQTFEETRVFHEDGGFGANTADAGLAYFRQKWGCDPWT